MPTEDALRGAAAELRLHADAAAVLLDDVTRLATEDLWVGPIADTFTAELGLRRSQLRSARDELVVTAQQLERRALAMQRAREAAAEAERLRRSHPGLGPSSSDGRGHRSRFVE